MRGAQIMLRGKCVVLPTRSHRGYGAAQVVVSISKNHCNIMLTNRKPTLDVIYLLILQHLLVPLRILDDLISVDTISRHCYIV